MNFFKKALVATAVVASFGASATATISSSALQLSKEGIADGVTATAQPLVFDVVVGVDTPAASTITLTFDNTIDLSGVSDGAVLNAPGTGTGIIATGTAGGVQFDYGTGSFTFDNVVVTDNDQTKGEKDTLSFEVNLGNALTAGSAFRISLGDNSPLPAPITAGVAVVAGAANLAYQSVAADDVTVIENGTGKVAEETNQFAFSVSSPFDSLISRTVGTVFTDATSTETAVISYTNNEDLAAALTAPALTAVVDGNFVGLLTTADFGVDTALPSGATNTAPVTPLANATTGATVASVNSGGDSDELTIALAAANASVDGTTELDLVFTLVTATNIPVTNDLETTATIIATNGDSVGTPITIATDVATGEWKIDATIINYPYMPLGYAGVQSTIQLANEGATNVDVIVTANDKNGVPYGPVNLDTLAGFEDGLPKSAVSKLSDVALMELLSAPAGSSLSITFNVDANEGVVNGYGYTQKDGTGRSEVSSSQQRGN
jgi:hypothetical protein